MAGPHAFLAREAPIYETGVRTVIGCSAAQIVLAILLRCLLVWRNKKRDREALAEGVSMDEAANEQNESDVMDDLTDFQNKRFRYAY